MKFLMSLFMSGLCLVLAIDDAFIFQSKSDSLDFLHNKYANTVLEERHPSMYTRDAQRITGDDDVIQQDGCSAFQATPHRRKPVRIRLMRTRSAPAPPPPPCSTAPCQNGATCSDTGSSFVCTCMAGYAGTQCTTDIDECSSNPCLNKGTCNDHVNSFSCSCDEDYIGTVCETDTCYPSGGADVAIIIDGSASQSQTSFDNQKAFVKSFISEFPISTVDFRFSIVSVSTTPTVHFRLDTHLTNDSLLQAIDGIQYTGGATHLRSAMSTVRSDVFNGVTKPKYLITFHDGMTSSLVDTLSEVSQLKAAGFTMASVGFGDQVLHQGLIDTAKNYLHVFPPTTEDLKHWMFTKHALEQCPDCSVHSADVFLLLEASSNLGLEKFYYLIDAMKAILARTQINQNGVHVSFASFIDTISERFNFVTHYTYSDVITSAITEMATGTSNYTKALEHVRENVFTTTNGYRSGSRKVLILFISEYILELTSVLQQADALKSDNVTIAIVSVALTTTIDISSLQQIVSDPAYLFVLGDSVYGDLSTLGALVSLFQYNECIFD